eukprot:CAMPEP_0197187636 /NCGR_PEP_ID=MMETSP1423-20130617/16241_1 /TAXON_ID=476441 /ORGANISM="Pseudo-nitzschia heimii, Strain UNC1101" /LENGTH=245 /DNA_ID=CAMNT_0042639269 /DNA_START=83 /DNA_END=820 /DNA_ORIENTATION=-
MGINNEVIVNRRQLLVKAGSFMKLSWRKSREKLFEQNEDNGSCSSNVRRGRRKVKNLSVRFCDEALVTHVKNDEALSDEDIENMWYQNHDYCRFKKDTILNSLNYVNARRASKPFDDTVMCIWGIEEMCTLNPTLRRRYAAEKKHVYKVIREEQSRQKRELQQKLLQQNKTIDDQSKKHCHLLYPNMEKFRSVSVCHSKGGRDRALARGNEYARVQRSLVYGVTRTTSSVRNLFVSFRTQSSPLS